MQNAWNWRQIALTVCVGFLGAFVPQSKSNIPTWLSSVLLGVFFSKAIFGDYDADYHWSFSDLLFVVVMTLLSLLGWAIAYFAFLAE